MDDDTCRRLHERLGRGEVTLPSGETATAERVLLPPAERSPDAAAVCARDEAGRCLLLEAERGNLCAIHRQLGPELLPAVCRLFPRQCVLQPRGVFVSLTHFCPSAAALLFSSEAELAVVRRPEAFPETATWGGLDAREHLPPLLRPNVLLSWEAYGAWERHVVAVLADTSRSPEEALALLVTSAEKLRATGRGGRPVPARAIAPLLDREARTDPARFRRELGQLPSGLPLALPLATTLFGLAPASATLDPVLARLQERYGGDTGGSARFVADWEARVRPVWEDLERPLRRYLAARLFASFFAYQGRGLRTGLWAAVHALATVRVLAVVACQEAGRPLDEELLAEAMGQTDYLLLHCGEGHRRVLLERYGRVEEASLVEVLRPIPSS